MEKGIETKIVNYLQKLLSLEKPDYDKTASIMFLTIFAD